MSYVSFNYNQNKGTVLQVNTHENYKKKHIKGINAHLIMIKEMYNMCVEACTRYEKNITPFTSPTWPIYLINRYRVVYPWSSNSLLQNVKETIV